VFLALNSWHAESPARTRPHRHLPYNRSTWAGFGDKRCRKAPTQAPRPQIDFLAPARHPVSAVPRGAIEFQAALRLEARSHSASAGCASRQAGASSAAEWPRRSEIAIYQCASSSKFLQLRAPFNCGALGLSRFGQRAWLNSWLGLLRSTAPDSSWAPPSTPGPEPDDLQAGMIVPDCQCWLG